VLKLKPINKDIFISNFLKEGREDICKLHNLTKAKKINQKISKFSQVRPSLKAHP
jgi:hypothetical protein